MRLLVDRVDYSYLRRNSVKIVSRKEDLFNGRDAYDIWVDVSDRAVSPEWYQEFEKIRRFYDETQRHVFVPTVMKHPGDWVLVVSHLDVHEALSNGGFSHLEPKTETLAKLADKYWAQAEALLLAHLSIDDRDAKAKAKRL